MTSMNLLVSLEKLNFESIQEFRDRLEKIGVVGLLLLGSKAENTFSKASDYDFLVITDNLPIKLDYLITYIDGRPADVFFKTLSDMNELFNNTSKELELNSKEGRLLEWIKNGEIIFDKNDLFQKLKKVSQEVKLKPANFGEKYNAWFEINFDLVHYELKAKSDKLEYLLAVDLRLPYMSMQLFYNYFLIRDIPWRGEKKGITYLAKNAPEILDGFENFVKETDRDKKIAIYRSLVSMVLEPLGGVWKDKISACMPLEKVNHLDDILKLKEFLKSI